MIVYQPGDVVLVAFPFSSGSSVKARPAGRRARTPPFPESVYRPQRQAGIDGGVGLPLGRLRPVKASHMATWAVHAPRRLAGIAKSPVGSRHTL